MEKREQLYEGKAKKVFATEDPDVVIVSYKDDATAFNGEKKGTIQGKGVSAGVASGADIILLPEIPYDLKKVCAAIDNRHKGGKKFTILAVAEGAIPKDVAKLGKKEAKKEMEKILSKYHAISYKLAEDITKKTGYEVRVTIPGHVQRGGSPDPFDRILSTKLGVYAAQCIVKEEYGIMVAMVNNQVKKVPLEKSAGRLKSVDPKDQTVQLAKYMGISFGD